MVGTVVGTVEGTVVGTAEGSVDDSEEGTNVGDMEGTLEGELDNVEGRGLVLGLDVGDDDGTIEGTPGTNTSPNISSTSIRYEDSISFEDLKLCKFGHTSSMLLSLMPSHDAIPRNGASQGVVGIIRPD